MQFHQKGVSDEAAVRRAELAAKALKQKTRQTRLSSGNTVSEPTRRNLRRATHTTNETETFEEEDPSAVVESSRGTTNRRGAPEVRRGPARNAATTRRRRIVRAAFSSDEEDEPSTPSSDE
ncbi:unnamed protein product [Echinostoma caproni]|uniref:Uncharacterized protein n=1 Tax=Echinostoma caproni TaxID=27848 RepID=A0A183BCC5_9TREM|nr:unnamed protein product [Echinostoma caproni]